MTILLRIFTAALIACSVAGLVKYNTPVTIAAAAVAVAAVWGARLRSRASNCKDTTRGEKIFLRAIGIAPPMLWVLLAAAVAQGIVVALYPWQSYEICDFRILHQQAQLWADGTMGFTPERETYFLAYPNNVNITILISWLLRLTGSWEAVIFVFATMVNLAAVLTGLTALNLGGSRRTALATAIAAEVYFLLSYDTYMPYTQNAGTLVVALIAWLYTRQTTWQHKTLALAAALALALTVKITTLIPLIAIALVETWRAVRARRWRPLALAAAAVVVSVAAQTAAEYGLRKAYGYTARPERTFTLWYYALLGQSPNTGGQHDDVSVKFYTHLLETRADHDAVVRDTVWQWVRERGVAGGAKFYAAKMAICFGDTRLDVLDTAPTNLPQWAGQAIVALRTAIWHAALWLMLLSVVWPWRRCDSDSLTLAIMLAVAGAAAFLCLFEASSRIAMMFAPLVFAMAGGTPFQKADSAIQAR